MDSTRLRPHGEDSLPCLSWCARLRLGTPEIVLYHGRSVEVEDTRFFEGAWSGEFAQKDFAGSLFFCGSGAQLNGEGVEFVTASHTLAPVFLLRLKAEVLVSNSLAFLLAQAEDELEVTYKFYAYDLMSIMEGIRRYVPSFPTAKGNRVEQFYFCNFHLDAQGNVTRREKPAPPAFASYEGYREFLTQQVQALVRNAADPKRRQRYAPITTASSGFDSTASSALAKAAGCTQVITFCQGRGSGDDSGRPVAERLGLQVLEYDREDYRQHPGCEVEFLATGVGGEDMVLAPLAELLAGKLLFTGFYGLIWDRVNLDVGPDVLKSDASGCSMEEFRLRVGFVHFPLPYLGCARHEDIHRISNSAAMKPWSNGNDDYDKPIPCRLLEEAGVPRHLFGQKKKAVTQPFISVSTDDPEARDVLSEQSFREFDAYVKRVRFFSGPWERTRLGLLRQLYRFNRSVLRVLGQAGLCRRTKPLVPAKYRKRISEHHLVFPWAVAKLQERYRLSGRPGVPAGERPTLQGRADGARVPAGQGIAIEPAG